MRKRGVFWWWASEKNIQKQRFCFLCCKPGRNKMKASAQQRLPWLSHTTELYGTYNMEENSPLTETWVHTQACFVPI